MKFFVQSVTDLNALKINIKTPSKLTKIKTDDRYNRKL